MQMRLEETRQLTQDAVEQSEAAATMGLQEAEEILQKDIDMSLQTSTQELLAHDGIDHDDYFGTGSADAYADSGIQDSEYADYGDSGFDDCGYNDCGSDSDFGSDSSYDSGCGSSFDSSCGSGF